MNYNLKNKAVAVIALAFMFTLAISHAGYAAEENAVPANPVDGMIQPLASATESVSTAAKDVADNVNQTVETIDDTVQNVQNAAETVQDVIANPDAQTGELQVTAPDATNDNLEFLNEQSPEDFLSNDKPLIDAADMSAQSAEGADPAGLKLPTDDSGEENPLSDAALDAGFDELKELDPSLPEADAPKSPLEKFGNAILSKVDNNLFNQMSHIEKEATLLQLEKKREELRTKVLEERQKSLAIIEATRRAKMQLEEERLKAEAERKAKILEEERKLKEKEMELEKLRQGKVINDYMNEMLMMNQKWVEKSAKLQGRIKELENERVDLIETFKTKMTSIDSEIQKTREHAVAVVKAHEKVISDFKKKIEELEGTINDLNRALLESRKKLKEAKEAQNTNPFKEGDIKNGPDKSDVDMSKQYAIMDITGQGDDIVAKIINTEGKVFIVHKGSKLKNGEEVIDITDQYILFENKGVNSYLYTGNTVMEFEPEATFGGTGELLSTASKEDSTEVVYEETTVNGEPVKKSKKIRKQTKPKADSKSKKQSKKDDQPQGSSTPTSPHVGAPSFGRGMFVR